MWKLSKKIIFAGAVITPSGGPQNDWLSYAQFIYPFMISIAAVLAVIMLIVAGLEMMTASEGMRSDAKQKIQNALLGLLLAVGTFLILKTINPDLLNLKIDTSGLKVDIRNNPISSNTNNPGGNVGDSLPDGTCIGPPDSKPGDSLPNGCIVGRPVSNSNTNTNNNSGGNVGDSLPNGTCIGPPGSNIGDSLPNGCVVGQVKGQSNTTPNSSCSNGNAGDSLPSGKCVGPKGTKPGDSLPNGCVVGLPKC